MTTKALPNLVVRKYVASDIERIEQLLKTHFPLELSEKRKVVFDWIARCNPVSKGTTNYLIVEADDKIIGYLGRMPVDMVIDGEKRTGYFFHDLLVDPEYRKKGLGVLLDSRLQSTWEQETGSFAVGIWMNEFTYNFLRRRRAYQIDAPYFVKPIDLSPRLTGLVRNRTLAKFLATPVRGLGSLYDFLLSVLPNPGISISPVVRFDRRFDQLAEEVANKFRLMVVRNSAYLNWKYIDKPFSDYVVLAAEREQKLAGFIVLLPRTIGGIKVGVIVDILADPADSSAISSLCRSAVNYFKQVKVSFCACLLTDENFIKVFRRHLFFKRRKTAPVMLTNIQKFREPELLKDIGNWFLTYGDSDGFVWQ